MKKRSNILTRQDQKEVRTIFKDILDLKNNWNQYNADSFDPKFVHEIQKNVLRLQYRPDCIVPTANDSIQIEYSCEECNNQEIYLEIEFFTNHHIKMFYTIIDKGNNSQHILVKKEIESIQRDDYEKINRYAKTIKELAEENEAKNVKSISN